MDGQVPLNFTDRECRSVEAELKGPSVGPGYGNLQGPGHTSGGFRPLIIYRLPNTAGRIPLQRKPNFILLSRSGPKLVLCPCPRQVGVSLVGCACFMRGLLSIRSVTSKASPLVGLYTHPE